MRQGPRPGIESQKKFAVEMEKVWGEFKEKYGDEKKWEEHDVATLEEMKVRVSELIEKCTNKLSKDHSARKESGVVAGWKVVLEQAKWVIEQEIIKRTP